MIIYNCVSPKYACLVLNYIYNLHAIANMPQKYRNVNATDNQQKRNKFLDQERDSLK